MIEHSLREGRRLAYFCLALVVGLSTGCARLSRLNRRDSAPNDAISAPDVPTTSVALSDWNLNADSDAPPSGSSLTIEDADRLTWKLQRLPDIEFSDLVDDAEPHSFQRAWYDVRGDHLNFYSPQNLALLGMGVGVAAALANTGADTGMRDFYQDNVRNASTDEYLEALHTPKFLGNGFITLLAFAGAAIVGTVFDSHPVAVTAGEWGERSLRTVLVGAPPLLLLQSVTGGSRPDETGHKSHWSPFQDDNGVSGHSFMGAVPFITAAQMTDDPWLKGLLYTASTAAGLSRINDDGHYPSQALLGWWLAYLASSSVSRTALSQNLTVLPFPVAGGSGIGVEYRW